MHGHVFNVNVFNVWSFNSNQRQFKGSSDFCSIYWINQVLYVSLNYFDDQSTCIIVGWPVMCALSYETGGWCQGNVGLLYRACSDCVPQLYDVKCRFYGFDQFPSHFLAYRLCHCCLENHIQSLDSQITPEQPLLYTNKRVFSSPIYARGTIYCCCGTCVCRGPAEYTCAGYVPCLATYTCVWLTY